MSVTYAIDAGIIRCICGFDDDDGFTIQCEKCNAWQHAQCVDIFDEAQVPDVYYCDQCSERKVNVEAATERQLRRLMQANNQKKRKSRSSKGKSGTSTRSASPGNDNANNDNNVNNLTNGKSGGDDSSVGSSRKRKRLTVENNKKSGSMDGHEIESKYTHSQSYLFYVVKQKDCKMLHPKDMTQYLVDISKADDLVNKEICTHLTSGEMKNLTPVKVNVKLFSESSTLSSLSISTSSSSSASSKKFNGFTRFGVFADSVISRNRYIGEMIGVLERKSEYIANPINQYRLFGCPKPGVFFVPGVDIAVDGRCIGSECSFLRKSCTPNVKISIVVDDKQNVKIAAFALDQIKQGGELTIGWEWDPSHPVHKLVAATDLEESVSAEEKDFLRQCVGAISNRDMECGCGLGPDCALAKMRRLVEPISSQRASRRKRDVDGYSAREERKLRETIMLIEKMEKSSKDVHAHANNTAATNANITGSTTGSSPSSNTNQTNQSPQAISPHTRIADDGADGSTLSPPSSFSSPNPDTNVNLTTTPYTNQPRTMPPQLFITTMLPRHKRMMGEFLNKRHQPGLATARTPSIWSPTAATTTTTTMATQGSDGGSGNVSPRCLSAAMNDDKATLAATVVPQNVAAPKVQKAPLKKLSFADYKKKLKPSLSSA